ncbi:MAG: hypothetical protein LC776_20065 [Acidobacteria bacterium]|nr:hypothetical protein [Acidobacteriota bacterium]
MSLVSLSLISRFARFVAARLLASPTGKAAGAFSIGQSQVPTVKSYIARQNPPSRGRVSERVPKISQELRVDYDEHYVSGLVVSRLVLSQAPRAQNVTAEAFSGTGSGQHLFNSFGV